MNEPLTPGQAVLAAAWADERDGAGDGELIPRPEPRVWGPQRQWQWPPPPDWEAEADERARRERDDGAEQNVEDAR